MDPVPLCEGDVETRLLPSGKDCILQVHLPAEESGAAKRPARFKIELGRLLQVGFGKPYELDGPDGHVTLREHGKMIEISYTSVSGLKAVCETLRKRFYERLIGSLRNLGKRSSAKE